MAEPRPTISAAGSSPQRTTTGKAPKVTKLTRKQKLLANPKTRAGIPDADLKALSPDLYAERLRQRQAHVKSQLANPGDRSKLPDSALTPELLATRKQNAYGAAPAAPGSSISNGEMAKLLKSLTQQKFGPAETALQQQSQSIPLWFQSYRDQVAGAQKAQQTGAAAQVGSLQQMAAQAAGDTGALAGAPMDAEGAARAQAAAQIRSAGVTNQAALAQNLGGNQDAFLQNLGLLSQGQQQAAMVALAKQQAQLAADKGDFQTTQRDKILGDESDSALKNALTQAQIGTQTATAANTAATTKKTQTETTKSKSDQAYFDKHGYYPSTGKPKAATSPDTSALASTAAQHGYTLKDWKAMTPDQRRAILAKDKKTGKTAKADQPIAGPGSLTPAEENKQVSKINKVLQKLTHPTKVVKDANGNETVRPSSASEVLKELRAANVDPNVLDVARSLLHNDGAGLGQMGVNAAHDLGIHVNAHWKVIR